MNRELALDLYRTMRRIRAVEEAIAERYPDQTMRCPVHLCIGQEAIAAGVCAALGTGDYALSGHRSHGHYLAKGGDLAKMIAELYGKVTGCCRGKGGSMHLIDLACGFLGAVPIVGSTIPIAVGTAFGSQMKGEPRVTVAFFGEGATEEGVLHESLNFAKLENLPVVFVCENNLYSVYSPMEVRQPADRTPADLARGHRIPARQADGNDALAVHALAAEAVARARAGDGPTFLEFATYRWREHCGPFYDNDLGYRSPEEFETWRARCPIERLAQRLRDAGGLDDGEQAAFEAALEAEISAAFEFAQASPFPPADELMEQIYAD